VQRTGQSFVQLVLSILVVHMIVHDLILATRRAKLTGIERFAINIFEASRSRNSDVVALVAQGSALAGSPQVMEMGSAFKGWLGMARELRQFGPGASVVCAAFPASPSLIATRTAITRVIHDAFAWTHPQNMTLQGRLMFAHFDQLMLRRYNHVQAPTEIARQDLITALGSRVITVCGNAPGLDCLSQETTSVSGLAPGGFILAVGTIEPRKNYERLIALAESNDELASIVIAGRPGWGASTERLAAACKILGNRLVWLDDADDAQLRWLYRNCSIFLSLSLAEGFNMPLVEAGISGCQIVCSDLPIHRSVAPPWARFVSLDSDDQTLIEAVRAKSIHEARALDAYRSRYDWATVAAHVEEPLRGIS
jgi:glycosyltransferase involved in cell wall biosynthesis